MPIVNKYIGFKTVREDWSLYQLEEKVLLKMKFVLIKALLKDVDDIGNPGYETNYQAVVGVVPPPNLRSKPSDKSYTKEEILDSIEKEDVQVEKTIQEDWNEYELEDGAKLSIKLVLTKASKTKLFDPRGDPIYNVHHQVIMKGSVPPELRKKYRERYART